MAALAIGAFAFPQIRTIRTVLVRTVVASTHVYGLEIVVAGKVGLLKDLLTIAIDAADVCGGHPCEFQPELTFLNLSAGMTPFFARKSTSGKYDIALNFIS